MTTTTTWTEWTVVCEPVGDNDGRNVGGLIVCLTDGEHRHEVTRVAYVREHARHPDVSFADQLQAEIAKAEVAAETVNDLLDELGRKQAEAIMAVRDRLHELLGRPLPQPA